MGTKPRDHLDPISEDLHGYIEASGFKLLRRLPDRRAVYLEPTSDTDGVSLCFRNEARLRRWITQAARRGKAGAA
jgi:hypothetical protein